MTVVTLWFSVTLVRCLAPNTILCLHASHSVCADPQNSQYTPNTTHGSVETRRRHRIACKRKAAEQSNTVHVENVKPSIMVRNLSADFMRIYWYRVLQFRESKVSNVLLQNFFYNLNISLSGSRHAGCQSSR